MPHFIDLRKTYRAGEIPRRHPLPDSSESESEESTQSIFSPDHKATPYSPTTHLPEGTPLNVARDGRNNPLSELGRNRLQRLFAILKD